MHELSQSGHKVGTAASSQTVVSTRPHGGTDLRSLTGTCRMRNVAGTTGGSHDLTPPPVARGGGSTVGPLITKYLGVVCNCQLIRPGVKLWRGQVTKRTMPPLSLGFLYRV
jgi:hypothetical protein